MRTIILTDEEADELEQLLLTQVYPEAYTGENAVALKMPLIFNTLNKVEAANTNASAGASPRGSEDRFHVLTPEMQAHKIYTGKMWINDGDPREEDVEINVCDCAVDNTSVTIYTENGSVILNVKVGREEIGVARV